MRKTKTVYFGAGLFNEKQTKAYKCNGCLKN